MINIIYLDDQRNKVEVVVNAIAELRQLLDTDIDFTFIGTLSSPFVKPLILTENGEIIEDARPDSFSPEKFPAKGDVLESLKLPNPLFLIDVHFEESTKGYDYGISLARFLLANGVERNRILLFTQFGDEIKSMEASTKGGAPNLPWFNYFDKGKFSLPDAHKRLAYELFGFTIPLTNLSLPQPAIRDGVTEGIIGESDAWKNILDEASCFALLHNEAVLILGDTGVGKELVAGLIHKLSPRRDRPFRPINCGAIPRDMIGAELFGVAKGAFTGVLARKGEFELAAGGSLFLDELGQAPIEVQAYLLRAIEEKKIKPRGGTANIDVDVRVIAATNLNPQVAMSSGILLRDLFYRINRLTIQIPPLRNRKDDILPLAHHFIRRHSKMYKVPEKQLTGGAVDELRSYDWPGNVRQLESVIVRACAEKVNDRIDKDSVKRALKSDLPVDINIAKGAGAQEVQEIQWPEAFEGVLANSNTTRGEERTNFREALALVISAAYRGDASALSIYRAAALAGIEAIISGKAMSVNNIKRPVLDILNLSVSAESFRNYFLNKVHDEELLTLVQTSDIQKRWTKATKRHRPTPEVVQKVAEKIILHEVHE